MFQSELISLVTNLDTGNKLAIQTEHKIPHKLTVVSDKLVMQCQTEDRFNVIGRHFNT